LNALGAILFAFSFSMIVSGLAPSRSLWDCVLVMMSHGTALRVTRSVTSGFAMICS
jgi:hypothetical protein